MKEVFQIALNLSYSTRPQDSTTSAYLFSVLTHQPYINTVLTQHIESAVDILKNDSQNEARNQSEADNEMGAKSLNHPHDNESTQKDNNGAKHKNEAEDTTKGPRKEGNEELKLGNALCNPEERGRYFLLLILLKSLESQYEIAKTSLAVAAANKPLYPTIQCMRYCFAGVNFRLSFYSTLSFNLCIVSVLSLFY